MSFNSFGPNPFPDRHIDPPQTQITSLVEPATSGFNCPLCGQWSASSSQILQHLRSFRHRLTDNDIDMIINGFMFPNSRLAGARKPDARRLVQAQQPLLHGPQTLAWERAEALRRAQSANGPLLPPLTPRRSSKPTVTSIDGNEADDSVAVTIQPKTTSNSQFTSTYPFPPPMNWPTPPYGSSNLQCVPIRPRTANASLLARPTNSPHGDTEYAFEHGVERVPTNFLNGSLKSEFEHVADIIRVQTINMPAGDQQLERRQLWVQAERELLRQLNRNRTTASSNPAVLTTNYATPSGKPIASPTNSAALSRNSTAAVAPGNGVSTSRKRP